jgi:hypothetical protein
VTVSDGGAHTTVVAKELPSAFTFRTEGRHAYTVTGTLTYPNGTTRLSSVRGRLRAWNQNDLRGNTEVTWGEMVSHHHVETSGVGPTTRLHARSTYPYKLDSYYAQDEASDTMEIAAVVDIGLNRGQVWAVGGRAVYQLDWGNSIQSDAAYNRTLNGSHVYTMRDKSKTAFTIHQASPQGDACFTRGVSAQAGWVESDAMTYDCVFPPGLTFCGYGVCAERAVGTDKSAKRPLAYHREFPLRGEGGRAGKLAATGQGKALQRQQQKEQQQAPPRRSPFTERRTAALKAAK